MLPPHRWVDGNCRRNHNSAVVLAAIVGVLSLPTAAQSADGWKRHSLSQAQLNLELPGEPKAAESKLKEQSKQFVEKQVTYQVTVPGVYVMISYTQYVEGIAVDLRRATDGAISSIKSQAGVTDAKFTTREIQRDDKPGLSISGIYSKGGKGLAYDALIIGAGRQLWQVGVGFSSSSNDGKNASRKVLGSVEVGREQK